MSQSPELLDRMLIRERETILMGVVVLGLFTKSLLGGDCDLPKLTAKDSHPGVVLALVGGRDGSLAVILVATQTALTLDTNKRVVVSSLPAAAVQANGGVAIPLSKAATQSISVDTSSLNVSIGQTRVYLQWTDPGCLTAPAGQVDLSKIDFDFRMDVGSVFLFNSDNTVTTKPEVAAGMILKPRSQTELDVDIRYSAVPAVSSVMPPQQASGSVRRLSRPLSQQDASTTKYANPSGSLSSTFGFGWNVPGDVLDLRAAVGVRTLVGSSNVTGFTEAPARASLGPRVWLPPYDPAAVNLFDTHRGFVEIGYSRDGFWTDVPEERAGNIVTVNQYNRLYAMLEYAMLRAGDSRLLLRGVLNTPWQLHGPTEVKLSALLTLDIQKLLTLLPVGQK